MSNAQYVVHYSKKGDTWDFDNPNVLEEAYDVTCNTAWGSVKDQFTMRLPYGNLYYDGLGNTPDKPDIKEGDLIWIYIKKDPPDGYIFTQDDLVIEGDVNSVTQSLSSNKNTISIKGYNWLETFFSVEIPVPFTSSVEQFKDKTFMEMCRNLFEFLKGDLKLPIEWDNENPDRKAVDPNDPTATPIAFPKKTLEMNYTPVYNIFEKLLGNEYTEDGQYIYYLSKGEVGKRKLSIRPKIGEDSDVTIDDNELDINSISISRNKDDIINWVVYPCGSDLYGNSVEKFTYDASSIGKNGMKRYYTIDETGSMFTGTHRVEISAQRSKYTFDDDGNLTNQFPSYPYTFVHQSGTGSYITVGDDDNYNKNLVSIALAKGLQVAQDIIQQHKQGSYKAKLVVPYTNSFVAGQRYQFNLSGYRKFNRPLRLKEINYTVKDTELIFDEDEKDREQ